MNFLCRLTLAIFLLGGSALLAETVYLRDGRVLTGRITNQSRTDITLATPQGVVTIQKDQIRRIQYDNPQQDAAKAEEARRQEELRREQERKLQEERLKEYQRQQELQRQQNEKRLEEERKQREALDEKKRAEEEKKRLELEKQNKADPQKTTDEAKRREEERLKEFEEQRRLLGPTWYGALARNLVLPGWGEVYQGRKTRGLAIGSSFAALTAFTLYEGERYRKNHLNYADTTQGFLMGTPFVMRNAFNISLSDAQGISWLVLGSQQTQRSRERMQLHADRLTYARSALLGLYVFAIADVVLFKPQANTQVGLGSSGEDLHVAFSARF